MIVEFRWREVNEYRTSVQVDEESLAAAGVRPDDPEGIRAWLDGNESEWTEKVDDWNACLTGVLERDVIEVTEVDALSGVGV